MSDIDRTRMIPLHIADQAVAACDAEIAKLREENARLKAEVERLTKAGEGNSMWGVVAPYVVPPCIDRYTAKEGKQSK